MKKGINSENVDLAILLVLQHGWLVDRAADKMGVAKSSVRRAMRRQGIAPMKAGRPRVRLDSNA